MDTRTRQLTITYELDYPQLDEGGDDEFDLFDATLLDVQPRGGPDNCAWCAARAAAPTTVVDDDEPPKGRLCDACAVEASIVTTGHQFWLECTLPEQWRPIGGHSKLEIIGSNVWTTHPTAWGDEHDEWFELESWTEKPAPPNPLAGGTT